MLDLLVLDDEEQASRRLPVIAEVVLLVIVRGPPARVIHSDDHVLTLAERDVDHVDEFRAIQRPAVLMGDKHVVAVEMEGHIRADGDQAQSQNIAFPDTQRLVMGKRPAVDGKIPHAGGRIGLGKVILRHIRIPAGEHEDCILCDFFLQRDRVFRIDDEGAPHASNAHVVGHALMAVIPEGARLVRREAVCVAAGNQAPTGRRESRSKVSALPTRSASVTVFR